MNVIAEATIEADPKVPTGFLPIRNGTRLVSCRAGTGDVTVVVEARGTGHFFHAVRASARAVPGVARPPPG